MEVQVEQAYVVVELMLMLTMVALLLTGIVFLVIVCFQLRQLDLSMLSFNTGNLKKQGKQKPKDKWVDESIIINSKNSDLKIKMTPYY